MDFIISHKKNILDRYGKEKGSRIISLIQELAERKDGTALFLDALPEEFNTFSFLKNVEPHLFKEFVDTVDSDSTEEGSILIMGGHTIIPFYNIANPTFDEDDEILTDAPYASRDEHFLIPQRIVGRIPDADGEQDDFFIDIIKRTIRYYEFADGYQKSFGYSASIWKEASRAVFDTIGDGKQILCCPPLSSNELKKKWLEKKYLYFNLHGVKETAHWYGQRGPGDPPEFTAFPIAITPDEVPELKRSCVCTEACYGAWIFGKSVEESLALKFLSRGAIAFLGSTAIAYGPPSPPSREADLISKYFLAYVENNMPFGDALRNAKVDFARTMIREQGFLDDDDKKTLLEFQLYGDPSLTLI